MTSFLLESISEYLYPGKKVSIELNTSYAWILMILYFGVASFNEEILYRLYLPGFLLKLTEKKEKKILNILIEVLVCLLFAMGHIYSGFLSVINAAIAHCVLRIIYKKTGNIFTTFTAHYIYNVISLILL